MNNRINPTNLTIGDPEMKKLALEIDELEGRRNKLQLQSAEITSRVLPSYSK